MLEPLIVSLADRTYEIDRPWALDEGIFGAGRVTDVATDGSDRLYVFNRFDRYIDPLGLPQLAVFEPNGKLLRTLELPEISDGHGVSISPRGEIILVDRDRHEIRILKDDGSVILTLGQRNHPGKPFSHPTAAAVGPQGDIFVTDGYGNSLVHRYSFQGEPIKTWGKPGIGPGQFSTPHGVGFTASGEVVICDRENNRIQFFDVEGTYIREVGDLYHPMSIVVDAEGMILVSDQTPRLSMFEPDGTLAGRCRPVLYGGHGMCVDSVGNIYFAETGVNRLTRLRRVQ